MEFAAPMRNLFRIRRRIAGHNAAVGKLHDQGRIVGTAIEVDEKARPARQYRRRIERFGKSPCHLRRSDVIGNVGLEQFRRETERAIGPGQRIRRVIADEQQAAVALRSRSLERRFRHGKAIIVRHGCPDKRVDRLRVMRETRITCDLPRSHLLLAWPPSR